MSAYRSNLLTAGVLVACSLWAFLTLEKTSYTALVPAGFGAVLVILAPGIKSHKPLAVGAAAGFTFVILVALYVPLMSALEGPASVGLWRVMAMMLTSFVSFCLLANLLARRFVGHIN